MTLGEKMKRIRLFRGMTQRMVGIGMGFEENSADVRIAQYETGKRTPKREALLAIAEILKVNPCCFLHSDDSVAELMQMFLWLEESGENEIRLFPIQQSENQVGVCIENRAVNEFLKRWMEQKELLKEGRITKQEYMEWKLNRGLSK